MVYYRRRARHGRGYREGGPRRWERGRGHWPQHRRRGARPSARRTTCWSSSSTSPTPPAPRPPCRLPSSASAASTCWSTTRATSIAGFFEEITPEDFRAQLETNLFGPLNVTRAVLPVMRAQRSGLVVTMSSTAGLVGGEFCTAYAASKFALEGWSESLTPEVAPFGIRTMLVEPGFFRTELLTQESTSYAEPTIADYAERTMQTVTAWKGMNGLQGGDPAKLAAGAGPARRPGRAAAALGRRCRRRRHRRAEGARPARPGRRLSGAVLVACARRRHHLTMHGCDTTIK